MKLNYELRIKPDDKIKNKFFISFSADGSKVQIEKLENVIKETIKKINVIWR